MESKIGQFNKFITDTKQEKNKLKTDERRDLFGKNMPNTNNSTQTKPKSHGHSSEHYDGDSSDTKSSPTLRSNSNPVEIPFSKSPTLHGETDVVYVQFTPPNTYQTNQDECIKNMIMKNPDSEYDLSGDVNCQTEEEVSGESSGLTTSYDNKEEALFQFDDF